MERHLLFSLTAGSLYCGSNISGGNSRLVRNGSSLMSGIDLSYFVDGGGMGLKIFIAGRQNEGGGHQH